MGLQGVSGFTVWGKFNTVYAEKHIRSGFLVSLLDYRCSFRTCQHQSANFSQLVRIDYLLQGCIF